MARADLVIEVQLSEEFKEFINLFCDTLQVLTDLNDLVVNDSCVNTTVEYDNIAKRIENIIERSKRVDYGKS